MANICKLNMANDLKKLRSKIDKLDKALIKVLAKRFRITRKIGDYKNQHNLVVRDPERENEILSQRKTWAEENGLDADLVASIFQGITKKVVQDNEKKN